MVTNLEHLGPKVSPGLCHFSLTSLSGIGGKQYCHPAKHYPEHERSIILIVRAAIILWTHDLDDDSVAEVDPLAAP